MTEKRFEIVESKLIKDGWVISDKLKQFSFPTLRGDKRALVSYCKALNELHSENEQFKQSQKSILRELLIYRRIASCSNCKYQNYDWFDDGDEFEICEKGNNEQQIAYHICKEWREI